MQPRLAPPALAPAASLLFLHLKTCGFVWQSGMMLLGSWRRLTRCASLNPSCIPVVKGPASVEGSVAFIHCVDNAEAVLVHLAIQLCNTD